MEKEKQDKFRVELTELYQKRAFECLALYSYWGNQFETITKQIDEYNKRVEDAKKKFNDLSKDNSAEARMARKGFQEDIRTYKGLIEKTGPAIQALDKKVMGIRKEAMEYLEQADVMKSFTINTPEQIAEKNKANGSTEEKK